MACRCFAIFPVSRCCESSKQVVYMNMLEDGYDVSPTMIYVHVLNRALFGIRIAIDGLEFKNPRFRRINLIIVAHHNEHSSARTD